jgi:hypothetical protein
MEMSAAEADRLQNGFTEEPQGFGDGNCNSPSALTYGWYRSDVFRLIQFVQSFTQLPSGRILAVLGQTDYLYYSDDEGQTWRYFTVPSRNAYTRVISTDSNEVFLE